MRWGARRADRVGACGAASRWRGIKIRVVKGANLAMEHVDAIVHEWPLATYADARSRATPTTSGCSPARSRPSAPTPCASASPATTCSTSRSPCCWPSSGTSTHRVDFEMLLGHGDRPGGCGAPRRRWPPAVHAGGAPGRVRLGDQLPHPAARGERQPGELHVGRVRARRAARCSSARSGGSARRWPRSRRRAATRCPSRTGAALRAAARRRLREPARHRPVASR